MDTFIAVYGKENRQTWLHTGTVYDAHFRPIPYTHVVAHGSGKRNMTDSMGIFSLRVDRYKTLPGKKE